MKTFREFINFFTFCSPQITEIDFIVFCSNFQLLKSGARIFWKNFLFISPFFIFPKKGKKGVQKGFQNGVQKGVQKGIQ